MGSGRRTRWGLAALAAGLVATEAALACSCLPASREQLRRSSVLSFDGRVTGVKPSASGTAVTATVQVVRRLKGRAGTMLTVHSRSSSTACGVGGTLAEAQASGALFEFNLSRNSSEPDFPKGAWTVSLCTLKPAEAASPPARR